MSLYRSLANEYDDSFAQLDKRLTILEGIVDGFIAVHNKGIEALESRIEQIEKSLLDLESDHLLLEEKLEKRIAAVSSDLADTEVQLDGHSVLIRQLAARVGLSVYEQQRILHEHSIQSQHLEGTDTNGHEI